MPDLTVNYAHAWESMYKGIDEQGPYYRVTYYFTDWTKSDTVANQLRGYTQRIGAGTVRIPPHQHPLSTNLLCSDVQIEGCGAPNLAATGYPSYAGGFLAHATYRPMNWQAIAGADPYNYNQIDPTAPILWCTQELDYDTEVYVHEKNQYTWYVTDQYGNHVAGGLDGKLTGIPISVRVGVTTMSLTFHQLPYLPMTTVRSLRNRVNSVALLGVPPGKLWFVGGRSVRDQNTDGTISQKVNLTFKERDVEWNKFLRKDIVKWDYVQDSSATRMFTLSDLTPLIQL